MVLLRFLYYLRTLENLGSMTVVFRETDCVDTPPILLSGVCAHPPFQMIYFIFCRCVVTHVSHRSSTSACSWWSKRRPALPQVYLPIGWSTYFFSAARVTFNASEVGRAKAQVDL